MHPKTWKLKYYIFIIFFLFLLHWRLKLTNSHSHTDVPNELSYSLGTNSIHFHKYFFNYKVLFSCSQLFLKVSGAQPVFIVHLLWDFVHLADLSEIQIDHLVGLPSLLGLSFVPTHSFEGFLEKIRWIVEDSVNTSFAFMV